MTSKYIPIRLRRWLESLGERCEYCQTSQLVTSIELEADHIYPRAKGGTTSRLNLCRACSFCNTTKSDQIKGIDPFTGQTTPLFHPRQQEWADHFMWSGEGTEIIGISPQGRATVGALKMNDPHIVRSRRLWVSVGWHPPT